MLRSATRCLASLASAAPRLAQSRPYSATVPVAKKTADQMQSNVQSQMSNSEQATQAVKQLSRSVSSKSSLNYPYGVEYTLRANHIRRYTTTAPRFAAKPGELVESEATKNPKISTTSSPSGNDANSEAFEEKGTVKAKAKEAVDAAKKTISSKVAEAKGKVSEKAAEKAAEVKAKAGEVKETVSEKAAEVKAKTTEVKEAVSAKVSQVKEGAKAAVAEAKDKAKSTSETVEKKKEQVSQTVQLVGDSWDQTLPDTTGNVRPPARDQDNLEWRLKETSTPKLSNGNTCDASPDLLKHYELQAMKGQAKASTL